LPAKRVSPLLGRLTFGTSVANVARSCTITMIEPSFWIPLR